MAALDFPDTQAVGDLFGSAGTVWRWDGARWASTAGASGARGCVAYAQITTDQTGLTGTSQDIGGLSVTFPVVAGRRYLVTGSVRLLSTNSTLPAAGQMRVTDAAGTRVALSQVHLSLINNSVKTHVEWSFVAATTGSATYKLMGRVTSGAGTVGASPDYPAFIMVEDITYEAGSAGSGAGQWTSYAVAWTAPSGVNPAVGNGSLRGRYMLLPNGLCQVWVSVLVGASGSSGGNLGLALSLPFPAHANHSEQWIGAKLYVPSTGNNFLGGGYIAAGATRVLPFFPNSYATSVVGQWRACDATNAAGTGVPLIAGAYSVQGGMNCYVEGAYRIAA